MRMDSDVKKGWELVFRMNITKISARSFSLVLQQNLLLV